MKESCGRRSDGRIEGVDGWDVTSGRGKPSGTWYDRSLFEQLHGAVSKIVVCKRDFSWVFKADYCLGNWRGVVQHRTGSGTRSVAWVLEGWKLRRGAEL